MKTFKILFAVALFASPFVASAAGNYSEDCTTTNSCNPGLTCTPMDASATYFQCMCPSGLTWNTTDATCEASANTNVLNSPSGGTQTTGTVHNGSGTSGGLNTTLLQSWADSIRFFINNVIVPLLTAIAFIVFLWGVFQYFIWGASNEESLQKGRTFVMYGIVGFVIIFSLWGLVNVGVSLLGVSTGARPESLPYPAL